jgi:hypothetical protein
MLKALLLAIITVLAVIVAAKLLYALVILAVVLLSAILRVIAFLVGGLFRVIGEVITLPFRILGMVLHPAAAGPVSGLTLGTLCRNDSCRCPNPGVARFCRQCGAILSAGR